MLSATPDRVGFGLWHGTRETRSQHGPGEPARFHPVTKMKLYVVPGGGVEPPRGDKPRRILSPLRLPVPPSRRYQKKCRMNWDYGAPQRC